MHWAKRCPHAHERTLYLEEETSDDCEEVQITLMATSMDTNKMNFLLGETLGCALLDSGCSKTVCGVEWLDIYLETLRESDRRAVIFQLPERFTDLTTEREWLLLSALHFRVG